MRIGITGSSGFMGSILVKVLTDAGDTVFTYSLENSFDAEDWEMVKQIPDVDAIVHLAARSFVPDSFKYPNQFINTNIRSTANMLELARLRGASMVFISSYVYGTPKFLPISEEHPLATHNPYAFSKILGEQLCRYYYDEFRVPVTVLRPFNVYGPGQREDFLIPTIIRQAMSGSVTLKDPRPKRDYVFVDDVVQSMAAVIKNSSKGFDIFNVGTGVSHTIFDIVTTLEKAMGKKIDVQFLDETRPNEILDTIADITKISTVLGWKPAVSFEEGINRCYFHMNKTAER